MITKKDIHRIKKNGRCPFFVVKKLKNKRGSGSSPLAHFPF